MNNLKQCLVSVVFCFQSSADALFRFGTLFGFIVVAFVVNPVFAGSFDVLQFNNDRLTISASQVSLTEVAQKLTELTGIPCTVTEGADQLITIDIVDETFVSTIAKISPNNLLVRKFIGNKEIITEVVFMPNDGESSTSYADGNLPTGEATEEVFNQEEVVDQEEVFNQEEVSDQEEFSNQEEAQQIDQDIPID